VRGEMPRPYEMPPCVKVGERCFVVS
jgi:hypothetical protein